MTIFLDLEETLVHSIAGRPGNPGRRRVVTLPDGSPIWVRERPLAKKMIEDCRRLAPTQILTGSSQDYASTVCNALGFAFAEDDILAWQKFLTRQGFYHFKPIRKKRCPEAVLIDNAWPESSRSRLKMRFLGIDEGSYFQVRTFEGRESVHFSGEWATLVKKLQAREFLL